MFLCPSMVWLKAFEMKAFRGCLQADFWFSSLCPEVPASFLGPLMSRNPASPAGSWVEPWTPVSGNLVPVLGFHAGHLPPAWFLVLP